MKILTKLNFNTFLNKDEIFEDDFKQQIVEKGLEVYTDETILKFKKEVENLIEKGEQDSLNLEEHSWLSRMQFDLSQLEKRVVLKSNGNRLIFFVKGSGINISGGEGLPEGTIKDWKGGKFIKKNNQWEPYQEQQKEQQQSDKQQEDQNNKQQEQPKEEQSQQQKSPEEYASSTSSEQLQTYIENPNADPQLKKIAHDELTSRDKSENNYTETKQKSDKLSGKPSKPPIDLSKQSKETQEEPFKNKQPVSQNEEKPQDGGKEKNSEEHINPYLSKLSPEKQEAVKKLQEKLGLNKQPEVNGEHLEHLENQLGKENEKEQLENEEEQSEKKEKQVEKKKEEPKKEIDKNIK